VPLSPWEQIDLSGTMNEALRRVATEVERRKVEQALRDAGGNKQRAAEQLQLTYKMFVSKQREFGIPD
jgi:DNA-binding NtrC family response regulator